MHVIDMMMSTKYTKSLFIFRRDLRVEDNTALNASLYQSKTVIPCFIFDPRQCRQNDFFSAYSFQFLLESLDELSSELSGHEGKLYIFEGIAENIVENLIKTEDIESVFFNRDYTPFSRARDNAIYKICKDKGISAHQFADAILNEPEESCKDDGKPYTVFTPSFRKNSLKTVKPVSKLINRNFHNLEIKLDKPDLLKSFKDKYNSQTLYKGGRSSGLKILSKLGTFTEYQAERDIPIQDATTHLSAHNKFGTVSIREVYHAMVKSLGIGHALVRQLYWRDFFTHIAYFFPYVFGGAFHKKYDKIHWENNKIKFKAWTEGKTGFPLVDAAIRELNSTGFMHNRARMVTASFLVKDLHIDWRWGEKYFASKLVDYDPAVNNGSWQWAASTGCDAQPYFRIFNPWLQQQKFDPDCLYIKKWLPELKHTQPKVLHNLFKNGVRIEGYPEPIVNHTEAASMAKEMYED